MRTKTLLLAAAAALAAGILSSSAQVYSANVVGYVNINLTNGVISSVAPTLDLDGTGTNNTISSIFPNPTIGDNVFVYNGSGYDNLSFISKLVSRNPNVFVTNWFFSGVIATNYPINPGQGAFYLPAANETATIVGTVLQGTNLTNGFFPQQAGVINLLSSKVPIAGGLTSALGYTPSLNDNVYIYDNGQYDNYSYISKLISRNPNVFVTNWFFSGVQIEPQISVGQGFWLLPANSSESWVQNFIVQ